MKYWSIFSVTVKSAMTPSFMGRMAVMLAGVRPSIFFASSPTAATAFMPRLRSSRIATTEGSLSTLEKKPRRRLKSIDKIRSRAAANDLGIGWESAMKRETLQGFLQFKSGNLSIAPTFGQGKFSTGISIVPAEFRITSSKSWRVRDSFGKRCEYVLVRSTSA